MNIVEKIGKKACCGRKKNNSTHTIEFKSPHERTRRKMGAWAYFSEFYEVVSKDKKLLAQINLKSGIVVLPQRFNFIDTLFVVSKDNKPVQIECDCVDEDSLVIGWVDGDDVITKRLYFYD